MVTIIPRAEERLQVRPLADVRREERAPNTGGVVAESQYKLGQAVAKEAMSFGELAIRKQEQVDRIELAKIKALRDSELKTVLLEEERNPDYEGMGDRITSRMKKYDDDLRKGVNGRLLKYVDPMIETEGAKLVPVLQGMYLKKQDDHASATALEAINQFIQNKDWDSAIATVDGMSWLDESKRAELKINIENKRQAHELAANAQAFAGDMLKKHGVDGLSSAIAEAREAYKGKDEDVYLGYVNSLFADAKQEREARREAVKEGFYGVYNRKGSFSAARDFINRNKEVLGEAGYASFMDMAQRMWEVGKYAPKPDKPVKKVMSRDEMIEFQRVFNEGKNFVLSGAVSTPGQMAAFNDRYGEALRSLSGDDRAFQDLLELTAPKAGGTDDKRGLYSANEMVSKRAEDAGILRSYEAYRDFDAEWLKACEKRAADEGRPLTKDEMVTEGDRLIEEKVIAGRAGFFSSGPLKAPEYQFRRLGVRAEDVRWNQKTNRYEVEKDGQFFMLEPDKDFYKLAPLKGDKRNFAPVKR
ncbi:MAG: hypothetical protein Q4C86_10910 [bacterium]|nr:hypothetical protein [bacterium]